jgi:hypothetical protein
MSAADDDSLSLRMIPARWVSTVLRLIPSNFAIVLLLYPSAISCTIWRSRGESPNSQWPERVESERSKASEALAVKKGLWATSASIAAMSSLLASDFRR